MRGSQGYLVDGGLCYGGTLSGLARQELALGSGFFTDFTYIPAIHEGIRLGASRQLD